MMKIKSCHFLAGIFLTLNAISGWAQTSACGSGWMFENITANSNGQPQVAGTPSTFSWQQANVGQRDEIYARNGNGQLIHYFRVGNGSWQGENLSVMTANGPTFRTDPVAVLGVQEIQNRSYNRHDIFAINSNDELVHYWWTESPPGNWHRANLTQVHNGPELWTKPIVSNSYYKYRLGLNKSEWRLKTDVYSIDIYGDLIHYWWTRTQGWSHENLTQNLAGPGFHRYNRLSLTDEAPLTNASKSAFHHLFGTSISGHLLHYWREPTGWRWENLSLVNGIQSHPIVASNIGTLEFNGTLNGHSRLRYSVFGFFGFNLIRYWSWNMATPWASENVTSTFGFNGSSGMLLGTPVIGISRPWTSANPTSIREILVRHDLYAYDSNRHLIHYWSADPLPNFNASNGAIPWQRGENLTTKIDGIAFNSDPWVVVNYLGSGLDNPEHYVSGRINDRLVNYCWNKTNGWSSRILQTVSTPRGQNVSADPAFTFPSTVGMSIYASGSGGDLLHFWKTL